MNFFSIQSETISHIEYDSHKKDLIVYFCNHTEEHFRLVPESTISSWVNSPHPDSFYSASIKGRYPSVRIQTEK